MHEPAYDPDPDHYVTWEYARGYADGVHDTLTEGTTTSETQTGYRSAPPTGRCAQGRRFGHRQARSLASRARAAARDCGVRRSLERTVG